MQSSKRILIAVDGSPHSLNAVNYVARNCARSIFINLIHIMPKRPEQVFWQINLDKEFIDRMKAKYERWEREQRDASLAFLESMKAVLIGFGFHADRLNTILRERQSGTATDIVAEAGKDYDALVIGRRGLNKVDSLLLGSVSNKAVELIGDIPVWLIGGDVRSRKILVAVDGSENSAKAVNYLAEFGFNPPAEISLCHVIRGRESFGAPVFEFDQEIEFRLEESLKEGLAQMFADYGECLIKAGISSQRISAKCITRSFSRAGDLVREAHQGGYGTIVMGRRGISKVREFLMGRVTTKVLNGAEGLAVWIVP